MKKIKIKKGDKVVVISGENKGSSGSVLQVLYNSNKAIVEGLNMVKRHTKPSAENPKGGSNKKLPLNQSIPLGIQHVLAMFAGNITVPIIIAGIFGQTPEQKIFLIQMALFVAGVATIIQTVGIY